MIAVPVSPLYHYIGDAAAWALAFLGARWVYRHRRQSVSALAAQTEPGYFLTLAAGAIAGAFLLGSLNSLRFAFPTPSHSIAGALSGGVVGVGPWEWGRGICQPTRPPPLPHPAAHRHRHRPLGLPVRRARRRHLWHPDIAPLGGRSRRPCRPPP